MTDVSIAFKPASQTRSATHVETDAATDRRYPARVARQLALAHALQRRVDAGEFKDYASMARALGFTRARVTQLMNLLLLAPEIQEEILFMEFPPGRQPLAERSLRPLCAIASWMKQTQRWRKIRDPT